MAKDKGAPRRPRCPDPKVTVSADAEVSVDADLLAYQLGRAWGAQLLGQLCQQEDADRPGSETRIDGGPNVGDPEEKA